MRSVGFLRCAGLLAAAALLTLYILFRIPSLGIAGDYRSVFFAWLAAIGLYFLALARAAHRPEPPTRANALLSGTTAWTLVGCIAAATLLRLPHLGSVPYVFSGDEAAFALWGQGLSFSPMSNPFTVGWLSQPTLGMFLELVSLKLLGSNATAARLPWALLSIPTVPVAFLLATRLRGTTVGLTTAALLAAYHFHIHYSRIALNNIADPLFMALALFWLLWAVERKSIFAWGLVGGACGLALYFYQGARLTPLIVGAVAICAWLRSPPEVRKGFFVGITAAAGGFAVVAAPMLQLAFRDPANFNARINQISIFKPGWLSNEVAVTGQPTVSILWSQLYHALGAFNLYQDNSPHYQLPTPLLDPLFGLLFLAGLLVATWKALSSRQDWPLLTMVFWWWSGIVIGGAMTFSPPTSQRLVTLTVPVCFFIALSLGWLARLLRRTLHVPTVLSQTAGALLFAAISLKTYFLDFTPLHLYGGFGAALITQLAPVLRALGPKDGVIFAGAPQIYWNFPTRLFLAPATRGSDALQPFSKPPSGALVRDQTVLFVFVPDRADELAFVRKTFPDGLLSTLVDPASGRVTAMLYRVTP